MAKRISNEEWIKRAQFKFPNLNFSKTQYINKRSNVCIICPKHGEFIANAENFMKSKYGCPKCGHDASNISRRMSPEDYINKLKSVYGDLYDYSKVQYEGQNKKYITLICKEHGEFLLRADDFSRTRGCPKCTHKNKFNSNEEFKLEMFNRFPNIKIYGEFVNLKSILQFECLKCGFKWESTASNLVNSKYGCQKCSCINGGLSRTFSHEEFIEKVKIISPHIEVLSTYNTSRDYVKCLCHKCNNTWETKGINLLQGHGCPNCLNKRENLVRRYLDINNINYIPQYKIEKPFVGRNFIKIDFYLPDFNTFIEYNGLQHYIPIEYFGGKLEFEDQVKRDENLRIYCKENNINLLEIKYNDNIEQVLQKFLNKFN